MSGHSKWANIKHKKGKADALRGKITTKISREITIAVRMGGADPTGNMKLKLALSKAKANNIPKDNIQRAIQRVQVLWKAKASKRLPMKDTVLQALL